MEDASRASVGKDTEEKIPFETAISVCSLVDLVLSFKFDMLMKLTYG